MGSRSTDFSGVRVLFIPHGEPPRPTVLLADSEGNLEWIVLDEDNDNQL